MEELTPQSVVQAYQRAKERRRMWESHWRECYDFALPLRALATQSGAKTTDKLFDGTAPDAVDQLAASLLSNLTPPWSRWVGLMPGTELSKEDGAAVAPKLESIASTLQSHFDRSNFAIEIHQCFLDLVTAGTACLMVEESALGEPSSLTFTAVPVFDVVFEDGVGGKLDSTLRRMELTPRELKRRYPKADVPLLGKDKVLESEDYRIAVIEAVIPDDAGYAYMAVAEPSPGLMSDVTTLAEGRFDSSPFINFRWLKAPGEIYGRSPVMKALPDIKTANKVVELILKNASIAVTGIWQAEDDGVLNPANIKLVPGAIIPKAVGSKGLTPLNAPGQFDMSNIVLESLRARIRSSLLADKLGQAGSGNMSATEVLERSADMSRILGATYGRLQSELLTPLMERAVAILRRRGEIPAITLDGRTVDIDYRSPLARRQAKEDAHNVMAWVSLLQTLGGNASAVIDKTRAARWMAQMFAIPEDLVLSDEQLAALPKDSANPAAAPSVNIAEMLKALQAQLPSPPPSELSQLSNEAAVSPLDMANPPKVKVDPIMAQQLVPPTPTGRGDA